MPSQALNDHVDGSKDRIPAKVELLHRTFGRCLIAVAAGVFNHDRDEAKVDGMARGRLDADLHGNAADDNSVEAAVA